MDSKLIPYRVHHYDFVYRNIKDAFLLIPFILIPTLIEEGYKALKRFWDISAENVKRNYTNAEILPPNGLSFSGFEIENGINGYNPVISGQERAGWSLLSFSLSQCSP